MKWIIGLILLLTVGFVISGCGTNTSVSEFTPIPDITGVTCTANPVSGTIIQSNSSVRPVNVTYTVTQQNAIYPVQITWNTNAAGMPDVSTYNAGQSLVKTYEITNSQTNFALKGVLKDNDGRTKEFTCTPITISISQVNTPTATCTVDKTSGYPGLNVTYTVATTGITFPIGARWNSSGNYKITTHAAAPITMSTIYNAEGVRPMTVALYYNDSMPVISTICPTVTILPSSPDLVLVGEPVLTYDAVTRSYTVTGITVKNNGNKKLEKVAGTPSWTLFKLQSCVAGVCSDIGSITRTTLTLDVGATETITLKTNGNQATPFETSAMSGSIKLILNPDANNPVGEDSAGKSNNVYERTSTAMRSVSVVGTPAPADAAYTCPGGMDGTKYMGCWYGALANSAPLEGSYTCPTIGVVQVCTKCVTGFVKSGSACVEDPNSP